jgi:hypothetical protein
MIYVTLENEFVACTSLFQFMHHLYLCGSMNSPYSSQEGAEEVKHEEDECNGASGEAIE